MRAFISFILEAFVFVAYIKSYNEIDYVTLIETDSIAKVLPIVVKFSKLLKKISFLIKHLVESFENKENSICVL